MSKRLVEVIDPAGAVIGYAEVSISELGDVGFRQKLPSITSEELKKYINSVASWFSEDIVEGISENINSASIEFGFKLAVQTGRIVGVLANVGSEASVSIRLDWERKKKNGSSAS